MSMWLSLFAVVAYCYFFWALPLQATGFMINLPSMFPTLQPYFLYSIDRNDQFAVEGYWHKVLINVGLLGLFAIPHSILARQPVKDKLALGDWYRSLYVFQAALFLHVLMHFWQPFDGTSLYPFGGAAATLVLCVYFAAWLWLVSSTFAIDHFELTGLKQGLGIDVYTMIGINADEALVERFHYKIVRHPIMLGFFVMFFVVPTMTVTHLFFSLACTTYILLAVSLFEEPDLVRSLGDGYKDYQNRVPMFCPFKCGKASSVTGGLQKTLLADRDESSKAASKGEVG